VIAILSPNVIRYVSRRIIALGKVDEIPEEKAIQEVIKIHSVIIKPEIATKADKGVIFLAQCSKIIIMIEITSIIKKGKGIKLNDTKADDPEDV